MSLIGKVFSKPLGVRALEQFPRNISPGVRVWEYRISPGVRGFGYTQFSSKIRFQQTSIRKMSLIVDGSEFSPTDFYNVTPDPATRDTIREM